MWFIHQPKAIKPMIAAPRILRNQRARLPKVDEVFRIMIGAGLSPFVSTGPTQHLRVGYGPEVVAFPVLQRRFESFQTVASARDRPKTGAPATLKATQR
jgi:hypothetical protein